ncbi:MAG: VOC family protein [Acidobacteria bacterium]|nr:VOC family protein [Acidobacteriota bacterium]MBI3425326.1 VOC family protein [Acidobacteriota bacterium]
MPINIAGFHHAGFLVTDVERAAAFYENILGLEPLPRPDLGFPGMWYDLRNGHQLHLMSVTGMPGHADPPRHDRHLALSVPDVNATEAQLQELGIHIAYGSGRAGNKQLFIRDPDGNTIELRPA